MERIGMQIGRGEFWLGDCLERMSEIPGGSVDLVVTSPPYDNLRTYNGSNDWSFDIFTRVAAELTRLLVDGGIIVWNVGDATVKGSETGSSFRQALHFKDVCGLRLHDTMIYHKSSQPKQNGHRYEQHFEYMFVLSKGKCRTVNVLREPSKHAGKVVKRTSRDQGQDALLKSEGVVSATKSRGNVWFYGSKSADNPVDHPAVFPIQLAHDHILSWSNPNDLILDPFGGSGTTAIAAERTGRRWICIEREPSYYYPAIGRVWGEVTQPPRPSPPPGQ